MIEKDVEDHLVREVEKLGGLSEKVTVIGARGFFDRLVVLPGGKIVLVEVKKPKGGRLSKHQTLRARRYAALGADVAIVKTKHEVDRLLQGMLTG